MIKQRCRPRFIQRITHWPCIFQLRCRMGRGSSGCDELSWSCSFSTGTGILPDSKNSNYNIIAAKWAVGIQNLENAIRCHKDCVSGRLHITYRIFRPGLPISGYLSGIWRLLPSEIFYRKIPKSRIFPEYLQIENFSGSFLESRIFPREEFEEHFGRFRTVSRIL